MKKFPAWLASISLAFCTFFAAPSPVEAGKGGGRTICTSLSGLKSSRTTSTWTSVSGSSMARDFSSSSKALRSLQDRQGGGSATQLGLTQSDMKSMRAKLDQHTDDTVLETPQNWSSKRLAPSHVSRSTDKNGKQWVNEHYADPGSCEARFVGMVREIPVSSSGKLQYDRARWSTVNSTPEYHAGAKAFARGDYLESFRLLGHTASWSETMRRTLATRVKLVLDNVPGYRAMFPRVKLPAETSVQLHDAPDLSAPVIRNLSASSNDEVLKILQPGEKDGYYKLGAVGNWDMVYDVKNEDVGFIHRIPGYGRRPDLDVEPTVIAG